VYATVCACVSDECGRQRVVGRRSLHETDGASDTGQSESHLQHQPVHAAHPRRQTGDCIYIYTLIIARTYQHVYSPNKAVRETDRQIIYSRNNTVKRTTIRQWHSSQRPSKHF